jgi:8-oxo-dGTP pyrophosphatase MutT (NUDIX family)
MRRKRKVSSGGSLPQQAAAIPFRGIGQSIEVCLIRWKGSETWGIPKGVVDPGDSHEETALNEALEEAGVRGRLRGGPIGTYEYAKWGATFAVAVYLLEVLDQLEAWQEERFRERKWIPLREVALLLAGHPVRPLLDHGLAQIRVLCESAISRRE